MLKQFINAKTPVLQEQAFFCLPIPIVRPTLDDFQIFFSIDAKDDAILLVNINTPVPRKIPLSKAPACRCTHSHIDRYLSVVC